MMINNRGGKNDETSQAAPLMPQGFDTNMLPPMTPEQAAAWMAQYGTNYPFFYGDPAAYGVPGGLPPPPYYYQGYPSPQGYSPVGHSHGQGVYAQNFQHPPPFATAPPPAQRPPRSHRHSSGAAKSSPLLSDNNRKTYSAGSSPEQHDSSIPPLDDIFSDTQPLLQPSHNSMGVNLGGYGAMAQPQQPKIYNAPPRTSSKSSVSDKVGRGLPRTNSASDFKHPLKSSGSSRLSPSHRRINSDGPLRNAHRRLGSNDDLPPIGQHRRSSSRSRSFSTGNVKKPTHRRADSASSMLSNVSRNSVVSNISKSEFFGGVDEKGRVQMHFPFEAIRLVMVDPEQPTLRPGHLYFDGHVGDFEQYEEYHRITEGEAIIPPPWESLDRPVNRCGCVCNNCNGCLGKKELLPSPSYMLAVDDNVYKAVMAEIANAHSMPCGLFFCGHHEDVSHPSILIAVFVVVVLFAYMFYLAYTFGDM